MRTSAVVPSFTDMWEATARPYEGTPPASLVPIAAGAGSPMFFVHWAPGGISFIRSVVDDFRAGRPVYGFESVGIADRRRPLVSVSDIATRYLAELRKVQPRGPYLLVGLCSGCAVAVEMARRIVEGGETVDDLVLIKSLRPGVRQLDLGWGLDDIYRERVAILRESFGAGRPDTDLAQIMERMKPRGLIDYRATTVEDFYWHQVVYAANFFAAEHYEPREYAGPAHVFQTVKFYQNEAAAWTPLLPQARTTLLDLTKSMEIMVTPEFAAAVAP